MRVRRPDGEEHACLAGEFAKIGAETVGHAKQPSLPEQEQVVIAQKRAEGVGVGDDLFRVAPVDAQFVAAGIEPFRSGDGGGEKDAVAERLHLRGAAVAKQDLDAIGKRQEGRKVGGLA